MEFMGASWQQLDSCEAYRPRSLIMCQNTPEQGWSADLSAIAHFATDEPSDPSSTAAISTGQQQHPAAPIEAHMEPVFLNKALKQMLDARDFEEYTFTMDKQLSRNPMLAMLFENCVQRLLAGKDTSVRQYTPLFSSPTSVHPTAQATFINLQVCNGLPGL